MLSEGNLDLYITMMILLCAAAIQWALREGKLDLYITMMILFCPAAIQWVLHKGKLDLYNSILEDQQVKQNKASRKTKALPTDVCLCVCVCLYVFMFGFRAPWKKARISSVLKCWPSCFTTES